MNRSRTLFMLLILVHLGGCAAEPTEHLDSTSDPVQLGYMRSNFSVATDADPSELFATGVISVPFLHPKTKEPLMDGNTPIRGTCGVTFISPRYAITAAHCVEAANVPNPGNTPLVVENYQAKVEWSRLRAAAQFSGKHPDYQHAPLTPDDGYTKVASFTCKVVSRCADGNPDSTEDYNCEIKDSPSDIALLHCPERPDVAPYIKVAKSDPGTGPVEMYWYHELVDAPTENPGLPKQDPVQDLYEHYTKWPAAAVDKHRNYHYHGGNKNQLLPLRSEPWLYGDIVVQRARNGYGWWWNPATQKAEMRWYVWTDLFGCHGTSGSGVLQRNSEGRLELLGPIAHTGSGWTAHDVGSNEPHGRLCARADTVGYGSSILSYTMLAHTQAMAQIACKDEDEGGAACPESLAAPPAPVLAPSPEIGVPLMP